MCTIGGARKQPLDEAGALVGRGFVEEVAGLGGGRDLAGQIETDPAEELGVAGGGAGSVPRTATSRRSLCRSSRSAPSRRVSAV